MIVGLKDSCSMFYYLFRVLLLPRVCVRVAYVFVFPCLGVVDPLKGKLKFLLAYFLVTKMVTKIEIFSDNEYRTHLLHTDCSLEAQNSFLAFVRIQR